VLTSLATKIELSSLNEKSSQVVIKPDYTGNQFSNKNRVIFLE
jgi:hypothetical protein